MPERAQRCTEVLSDALTGIQTETVAINPRSVTQAEGLVDNHDLTVIEGVDTVVT